MFAFAVMVLTSARAMGMTSGPPPCPPALDLYGATAFITSPVSASAADSTQPILLEGYAPSPGTISVYARNWADAQFSQVLIQSITVPNTAPLTTPSGTLYYWTSDLTLAQPEYAEYWVPSIDPPDTTKYTPNQSLAPASVGRLELSFTASFIGEYAPVGAYVGVTEMATFSEAGMTCYAPGGTVQSDPFAAAVQCADGAALVLFDVERRADPQEGRREAEVGRVEAGKAVGA